MALPNIYHNSVRSELSDRIQLLFENTPGRWGKMTSAQMLAHLNVMFAMALELNPKSPNKFVKFILQTFFKKGLISEEPYTKNSKTAPQMVIKHSPDFDTEQKRLLAYLDMVVEKGEDHFTNKKHPSFGVLHAQEWNNLFYKHIDHHLIQFGV